MFKKTILATAILFLSGCAIAPGMKMKSPPASVASESNQFRIEPTFVPVTAWRLQQMQSASSSYDYYVGPQDILSIVIWDHPEFKYPEPQTFGTQGANTEMTPSVSPGGFLVDMQGNINFPLIGKVSVAGKTANEIGRQMVHMLGKYVRHPQVNVRVAGFRSKKIYVIGEVNKAGLQPLTDVPLTITSAIGFAGGVNVDSADPSHIYVIRGNISRPTVYWLDAQSPDALLLGENFRLQDRDILFVSTAGVARWNRAINLILPTLQTAWTTLALLNTERV